MAVGVQKAWSVTASSNGNSDTNANWAEGMLAPSINNSARANMAAIKGWSNQISGGCTCAGSSNAYTITSDAAAAISTAYAAGMMFMLKANHTNSGAATLNVDGVGDVAITTSDGGDVVAGDIVSGGLYLLAYNSTGPRFELIGSFAGGAYQPLDADLTAIAALGFSARAILKKTAANTWTLQTTSDDVDAFISAADKAAMRTALGLGTIATQNVSAIGTSHTFANSLEGVVLSGGGRLVDQGTTRTIVGANGDTFDVLTENLASSILSATPSSFTHAGNSVYTTANVGTNGATLIGYTPLNKAGDTMSGTLKSTALTSLSFERASHDVWQFLQGTPSSQRGLGLYNGTDAVYGLFITDAEDVGIGTTAPAARLDVVGGDTRITLTPSSLAQNSAGFRGLGSMRNIGGSTTLQLSDAGQGLYAGAGAGSTWTIPPNSSVAFPTHTVIPLMNISGGNMTIAEGSGVTLYRFDGVAGTGSRTLPSSGFATLIKFDTNLWAITGVFS